MFRKLALAAVAFVGFTVLAPVPDTHALGNGFNNCFARMYIAYYQAGRKVGMSEDWYVNSAIDACLMIY